MSPEAHSTLPAPPVAPIRAWGRMLEELDAAIRRGGVRTVLIEGEEHTGKSEYLHRICAVAPVATRLRVRCSAVRASVAFGVFDQLAAVAATVRPGLRPRTDTAEPALAARSAGTGLAVQLSQDPNLGPLLIAVEDLEWIDGPSAAALTVLAGLLRPLGVLVVATLGAPPEPVPRPGIEALLEFFRTPGGAYRITLPQPEPEALDEPEPRGFPGDAEGIGALPREELYRAVLRDLAALPERSLRLLAAMAVVDRDTPLPILAAVADVADPSAALEDLIDSGFVDWFPHGLIEPVGISGRVLREAVYWNLPAALRRATHLAAAEQISGVHGLGHEIAGTRRRNRKLAARLEEEALRYHAAGDVERAGSLLLWAADVSREPEARARRLRAAAWWGAKTPTAGWAAALEERLVVLEPSVERNLFLGRLAVREVRYEAAYSLYEIAHKLAADRNVPLLAEVELAAAALHADTGDFAAEERAASSVLELDGVPAEAAQWAAYYAADAYGGLRGSASASLRRLDTLALELRDSNGARSGRQILCWARGVWLAQSGRAAQAVTEIEHVMRRHDGPTEQVLATAHAHLGYALFQLGDWRAAAGAAGEAMRIANARGDRRAALPAVALAACISALRGDWGTAAERVDSVTRDRRALGSARDALFPALAAATLAQARGEPGRMLTALITVAGQPELFARQQLWWRPLYVEALIQTGRLTAAATELAALRAALSAEAEGRPRPSAIVARLEAGLAAAEGDPAAALERLACALGLPADEDPPLDLAGLEYEYGRLLLGTRRRKSAIRWLLSAHERYLELGAQPFADRCLKGLKGLGAQPQAADPAGDTHAGHSTAALTAQEHRIARLAADGMTNQQIAHAVYVSSKTIEYHLGNAFAKLGIASRHQLRAVLEGFDGAQVLNGHRAGHIKIH